MRNFLFSTFYSLEKFSKKCYIQNSLNPVCIESGMGCVIVLEDSLDLLTALEKSQETINPVYVMSGIRHIRFALNLVGVVLLSKETP